MCAKVPGPQPNRPREIPNKLKIVHTRMGCTRPTHTPKHAGRQGSSVCMKFHGPLMNGPRKIPQNLKMVPPLRPRRLHMNKTYTKTCISIGGLCVFRSKALGPTGPKKSPQKREKKSLFYSDFFFLTNTLAHITPYTVCRTNMSRTSKHAENSGIVCYDFSFL